MGWIIERGMVPVNCEIAIFDLKGALAPQDKPLMLQPVLFCPVLTWAAQELMDCGVQRYFIHCCGGSGLLDPRLLQNGV